MTGTSPRVWQFIWVLAALTAVALVGLMCLGIATSSANTTTRVEIFETACIDRGGIPVIDHTDGNECVFAPTLIDAERGTASP